MGPGGIYGSLTAPLPPRIRFLLGGRHGEFRFVPPPGYAPCAEALLPRERLRLEPLTCYRGGAAPPGARSLRGPTRALPHTAFTPCPVDTAQIVLPPHLERIREKLAENIHELWALTRIEQGWTYGPVRDDVQHLHPCLLSFQNLPEPERGYNLQMSGETLKTLLALGCHVGMADEKAEENLKKIKLPKSYTMSNGYKPAPLDLAHVRLTPAQLTLVDRLAENGHNVWARDRVQQGWTYSTTQDIKNKRNPRLVPYNLLDEATKATNRESLCQAVRTLLGYGYNIEPPDQDSPSQASPPGGPRAPRPRLFRAERGSAVRSGRWYFEFTAVTPGEMRVGWARPGLSPDTELGADEMAFVFNGHRAQRWHVGSEPFGRPWQAGDVVGCLIDLGECHMSFTLNGEALIGSGGSEVAFRDFEVADGFVPVCSLGLDQEGHLNLGQDVATLRYFGICGLQEGYEPFAINMKRPIALWFSHSLPQFVPVPPDHPQLEVTRVDGTVDSPPCLRLCHRPPGTPAPPPALQFLRLSLPVQFHAAFRCTPGATPLPPPEPPEEPPEPLSEFERLRRRAGVRSEEGGGGEGGEGGGEKGGGAKEQKGEEEKDASTEKGKGRRGFLFKGRKTPFAPPPAPPPVPRLEEDVVPDERDDPEVIMNTTTYYYSVRLFAGQEPGSAWVGWVTPHFHQHDPEFELSRVRSVTVTMGDERGNVHDSIKRSDCYMVWGGEFAAPTQQARVTHTDLVIGCLVDLATGLMTFTANGKEINTFFQVEPNTKLFPAVFVQPSTQNVLQFELGKLKNIMPISAAMFSSERQNPAPQCPPRLLIQHLSPVTWSRLPGAQLGVESARLGERQGWAVECSQPLQMMALHIPEEDRCIDILELWERQDLLQFHCHTLRLYCAVCALGNNRVAHALCSHCHLNPSSVYSTKSARERALLGLPPRVEDLCPDLPDLGRLLGDIGGLAASGARYTEMPHVIEVALPMLCHYLPRWWERGRDAAAAAGPWATEVTGQHLNELLGHILRIVVNNLGIDEASWMKRLAVFAQPIVSKARPELLRSHFIPTLGRLRKRAGKVVAEEEQLRLEGKAEGEDAELLIRDEFSVLCRDLYALYPLLIRYVDNSRAQWLTEPNEDAEELFRMVGEVFILWSKSHNFKREEQNFVVQNEINNMSFLTADSKSKMAKVRFWGGSGSEQERSKKRRRGDRYSVHTSLIVATLKKMLPIGLNMCSPADQELIALAKGRYALKDTDEEVREFLHNNLHLQDKVENTGSARWQMALVRQAGGDGDAASPEQVVRRVQEVSAVLYHLEQTEHPYKSKKAVWHKLLSKQRRRAVVACFRMTPLYNLPRHRACNMFLESYRLSWLGREQPPFEDRMIDDLSKSGREEEEEEEEAEARPDPLHQLILHFSRTALTEQSHLEQDHLYMAYAGIMAKSCHIEEGEEEEKEEEEKEEEGAEDSFEEKEMEKQKLLSQQARLHTRGAAEMVLQMISACKGGGGAMVSSTLKLGISILNGGNADVQQKMLEYLKSKREVGFFQSVQALMQTCSVLDLNAFERQNKAEGLGMVTEEGTIISRENGEKVMSDDEFTQDLFRLLQLLCEGHNNDFQNYLRTQTGNTTTINIIICTVDYLLRLQESISDFYWYYSGKDVIDEQGKRNFSKAMAVAKQVFNSLTEYIQGPCTGNQQSLAHSRLWDAVVGFLHVFAHMMKKLAQDSSQLGLLKELLDLQKDMVVMLLSLLEGNVVNGTIARQMVDMLVESSSNVTMILKFFDMFLKLRDIVSSDAFRHFVTDPRGLISKKDFQKAMDSQKQYEPEEIQFLLSCSEADENEMIDVESFAQRFQEPARDIGFNVAVLLTNLSEHVPHDQRLKTFLEQAESILDYFRPFLGRIEIMGAARRIERIYFEISGANKAQWEMPQVKESKRQFIFDVVNEGGEAEKMELFVNFCEDTIFEMQIASRISEEEAPRDEEEEEEEDREEEEAAEAAAPVSALPGLGALRRVLGSPQTWRRRMRRMRKKSGRELAWEAGAGVGRVAVGGVLGGVGVLAVLGRLVWSSLFGGGLVEGAQRLGVMEVLGSMPDPTQDAVGGGEGGLGDEGGPPDVGQPPEGQLEAAAMKAAAPAGPGAGRKEPHFRLVAPDAPGGLGDIGEPPGAEPPTPEGTPILRRKIGEMAEQVGEVQKEEEPPAETEKADTENGEKGPEGPEGGAEPRAPPPKRRKSVPRERREPPAEGGFDFWGELEVQRVKFLNYLSRNFYNLRFLALFLAFAINFILLFYKVSEHPPGAPEEPEGSGLAPEEDGGVPGGAEPAGGAEEPEVYYFLEESTGYMGPALRGLALAHTLVAFLCIIGYNCLKIPLVIFKREKEVARRLEFSGLYITEQPPDDDVKGQWDRLVLNAQSFPSNYWDKFIKRKVLEKYGDIYGRERIAELLGMDLASLEMGAQGERRAPPDSSLLTWITSIDIRYQIWKFGVIFTDNSFLYLTWYMAMSLLGHYNNFFFASHLLDIAMGVKTLRTILSSVTHNGKQLVMTVGLLAVVVYLYTVVAFNFFRKFYNKSEDEDEPDMKCDDMMTCYLFHMYVGVRAGGGIGDEIEDPAGDDYELYRVVFDITFFFFVIVILLAIIQGLIIDAFGELRDQQEQVKEDMETKCFICGIGSDYFDTTPHGFETHTLEEHNLANYMFFLMYLINKDETEHTGQESYVWKMYQERCWDFFPAGDCFRKQYEDQLG
ncbi:ryanodine receptor 1-like [Oenanthe melanoleuca]|uniref:ryanodine receptor 1-like n=1 Tax=Oenanthe melanoleuca TaxID=2939378 RepID=UPI0024C1B7FB|nr:ryanodine receptor 1-like [Oenanthe melanoleuca]